ncbi:MAG: AAA family ATPase [Oscillospiraceae bacterium]|nr:AAA family ATPase [Oscillospiraceae bacterium]
MLNTLDIREIRIDADLPKDEYYTALPAVRQIAREGGIVLTKPITFFIGENGIGKSTLIEAVAVAAGFNPEGGSRNYSFSTNDSHSDLCEHVHLVRGADRHMDGFFLRAESFYNAATYLDSMDARALRSYGGRSLHKMSHGESFLALVENRFSPDGLFILDEPEAAVSPTRMLRLMADIHELAKGGAQFIISTHSPLLITLPGADILQFTEKGMARVPYEETEHFRVTRDFLADPQRMLRILLED